MKLLVGAAMAMFAVLAVSASAAMAAGPVFSVEGVGLAWSESIEAEASGAQVLTASSVELECSTVSATGSPALKGTEPGTDTETLTYGGCIRKAHSTCEARTKGGSEAGVISTKALKSELAYPTKTPGEKTDTVFEPSSGKVFVEIELKGTECGSITSGAVEGSVAVENEEGEREVQTLTAPATPITKVFNEAGTEKKVGLKAFGFLTASYVGKDKIKLTEYNRGRKWGAVEIAKDRAALPAEKCKGIISLENLGPGAIFVYKEKAFECTSTLECEGKNLLAGAKCESKLTTPLVKPEYEFGYERAAVKFEVRLPV
jgi:hypothetical protein